MKKPFVFIFCLLFFSCGNRMQPHKELPSSNDVKQKVEDPVAVKSYLIRSVDGEENSILVFNDYNSGIMRIVYDHDTLYSYDNFYGDIKVNALNDYFLQIVYGLGGGSGVENDAMMLVCIKGKKLHVALDVLSYSSFMGTSDFQTQYEISLEISAGTEVQPVLMAFVHQLEHYDGQKPQQDNRSNTILHFDEDKCVFFTHKQYVDKHLVNYDFEKDQKINIHCKGQMPAVMLPMMNYYFMDGKWRQELHDKGFSGMIYRAVSE